MAETSNDELLQLGILIDSATDSRDAIALDRAIETCDRLLASKPSVGLAALVHYFAANAWEGKRLALRSGNALATWDQPELESAVFHLRMAVQLGIVEQIPEERQCQILTNLANVLSHVGRPVEAIEYWDRALGIISDFSMARGNRGYGLECYALLLHDPGHQAIILRRAYQDLSLAMGPDLHPDASSTFRDCISRIEARLPSDFLKSGIDVGQSSLGESEAEVSYRRWCLHTRLFLNPLNDLGPHAIAATDPLHVPSIAMPVNKGPYYAGFFNQLKQEFVSARFLLYEGIVASEPHYSDRNVTLVNTLDYPVYCLAAEKVKLAFRTAYSLFDKIAFLLNHYLALGLRDRDISFKTIWYKKRERDQGVSPDVEGRDNNALRGLYWLSKDLSEKRKGFMEAMEPDAQQIEELRQSIEHRYVKVHEYGPVAREKDNPTHEILSDSLAWSVARSSLLEKALRIQRMARAALIYLCLAIHIEEARRARARGPNSIVMPMHLDIWEDEWKV